MDADAAAVGALGVKGFGAGGTVIQVRAVEKGVDLGIDAVPQLMAHRRTQVLHHKHVSRLAVPAPAPALGDRQFHTSHRSLP